MPDASKPLLLLPASRFLFMLRFHLNVTNSSAAQKKLLARFGYGVLGGDLGKNWKLSIVSGVSGPGKSDHSRPIYAS